MQKANILAEFCANINLTFDNGESNDVTPRKDNERTVLASRSPLPGRTGSSALGRHQATSSSGSISAGAPVVSPARLRHSELSANSMSLDSSAIALEIQQQAGTISNILGDLQALGARSSPADAHRRPRASFGSLPESTIRGENGTEHQSSFEPKDNDEAYDFNLDDDDEDIELGALRTALDPQIVQAALNSFQEAMRKSSASRDGISRLYQSQEHMSSNIGILRSAQQYFTPRQRCLGVSFADNSYMTGISSNRTSLSGTFNNSMSDLPTPRTPARPNGILNTPNTARRNAGDVPSRNRKGPTKSEISRQLSKI